MKTFDILFNITKLLHDLEGLENLDKNLENRS